MLARLVAAAIFSLVFIASAQAQYPNRPIRLIVPAAPGGGTDITTRGFAPALQDNLGQAVVIENRGGAGGVVGSDVVAKAAPDGYTLLLVYISHATNPTLVARLPYDTLRDFTPIVLVAHEPTVLVTHPTMPPANYAEFVAYLKECPGKLSYATDPGSAGFLAGELFKQRAGVQVEYVPYKGSGPAAADVVAGHLALHVVGDLHHHAVREGRAHEGPCHRGREARPRPAGGADHRGAGRARFSGE